MEKLMTIKEAWGYAEILLSNAIGELEARISYSKDEKETMTLNECLEKTKLAKETLRKNLKFKEVTADELETLLSMEHGGFDYWCNIGFEEEDYDKAKSEMRERGIMPKYGTAYCYEQVVAYMIFNDYKVVAYDFEDEKEYTLTTGVIEKGMMLNAQEHPEDSDLEEGDANTGDRILQYGVFGEVVYG